MEEQRVNDKMFSGMVGGVLFFRVQPAGLLSKFRLFAAYGEAPDYTNVRQSNELIIHPGFNLNISRHLNIEIDPNMQRLSYGGRPTFTTYLLGTTLVYHFNKNVFLRSIFQ